MKNKKLLFMIIPLALVVVLLAVPVSADYSITNGFDWPDSLTTISQPQGLNDYFLLEFSTFTISDSSIIAKLRSAPDNSITLATFDMATDFASYANTPGLYDTEPLKRLFIKLGAPDASSAYLYVDMDDTEEGTYTARLSDYDTLIVKTYPFAVNTTNRDIWALLKFDVSYVGSQIPSPPDDGGSGGVTPPVVDGDGSVMSVWSAILAWITTALASVQAVFFVNGSLTFIGTLAIIGVSIAIAWLIIAVVERFLRLRG